MITHNNTSMAGARKITFGLIALTLIMIACGTSSDPETETGSVGDSWESVQQQGNGTVNILYVPSGGFAYENEKGELTGVTIEILREFVSWVEYTYEVGLILNFASEPEWQKFYTQVSGAGPGLIGTGNVTITEERRNEVQFSPPYLDNIAVLVSHADRPELTSLEDIPVVFAGKTGLLHPGTLHADRMEKIRESYFPGMPVISAHSNDELMDRMAEGDYYFTYLDVHNFVHGLGDGVPMKRHEIGDDANEQFGFIMPPDSDWGKPLDDFFAYEGGFVNSQRYRDILRKHLGDGIMEVLGEQENQNP